MCLFWPLLDTSGGFQEVLACQPTLGGLSKAVARLNLRLLDEFCQLLEVEMTLKATFMARKHYLP